MFDARSLPVSIAAAMCPSCHAARVPAVDEVPDAGGGWICRQCGEHWTASRLATVADYEAWNRVRDDDVRRAAFVIAG